MAAPTSTVGFDVQPNRHPLTTFAIFLAVVALSVGVAVGFRESAFWVIEHISDHRSATAAADRLALIILVPLTFGTLLAAAALGRYAAQKWPGQAGLETVSAMARGADRRISLRATTVRMVATWLITVGLAPVGRESAIIESGGAIGSTLGRRFGGRGAAAATAGVAAAFAAAYHAPFAAIVYVEEHLEVRGSRRATRFAIGGALLGFVFATQALDVHTVFPAVRTGWLDLLVAGAIAVVPATLAAKVFKYSRSTLVDRARARLNRVLLAAIGGTIITAIVVLYPLAAGNGMDAMRGIHGAPPAAVLTAALVVAIAVGKLLGTSATFAGGAPGGALTPSIVVGAGAALAVTWAAQAMGAGTPDLWALAVLAGAAAIAVSLHAPLTAIVLLPELTGSYRLLPITLAVVVVAVLIDRSIDKLLHRRKLAALVRDEDA